jgi:uncharacterized membrane protein
MRRAYIDWLRGFAVVAMIEWHVIDAWSIRDERAGLAWAVIRTVGGFAAPLFLYLAGLATPFAMAARERRGATTAAAAWSVQKRGWQVFGLAHVFRFQSFLLNPNARWSGILKPDILNILGLGLAGTAWLCGRAVKAARGHLWLVLPAAIVLVLTPFSRLWWWPTLLHPRLEAYIRPVGNFGVFSLFPWVAYVPLGAYVGLLLLRARQDADERRVLTRLAAAGLAVAGIGSLGFLLEPNTTPAFWLGSFADFLIKAGVMTAALGFARWLVSVQPQWAVAPMVLLGQTSLFVYWVHVELAYGVWSYPIHYSLPIRMSVPAFAGMVALMYYAGRWWASRPGGEWIPRNLRAAAAAPGGAQPAA